MTIPKSTRWWGPPLAISTLIAGVAALVAAKGDVPAAEPQAESPHVAHVEVVKPQRRELSRVLKTPGSVAPYALAELYAKTSGYLKSIDVDIGDRVRTDQVLAVIDVPEMADELRAAQATLQARRTDVQAAQAKLAEAEAGIADADARLEATRQEVRRYQAEAELQRLTADRKKELRAGNAISQQDLDESISRLKVAEADVAIARARIATAEARLTSAKAARQSARAALQVAQSRVAIAEAEVARMRTLTGYARIKAPFAGTVIKRNVDPGDFIRSAAEGQEAPLLVVARTDKLRIRIEVPGPDVPYVRPGSTTVDLSVKALPGKSFTAPITRTSAALNPATRTMSAEIHLDNPKGLLRPGMYANAVVHLSSEQAALVVPSATIHMDGDKSFVYLCRDDTVAERQVKVGLDDGIWAQILDGCTTGDLVIASMPGHTMPGDRVEPVERGASR